MDKEVEGVIDEVRVLWNALVAWGEHLHASTGITIAMRAVLEYLSRNGPTSVPNIARARRVTRQYIQVLVNDLESEGYVSAMENPAHRRSPLFRLTKAGERLIDRMRRNEARALDRADIRIPRSDLRSAADVLRALRSAIEG